MSLDQRSTLILSHLVNAQSYVPLKEIMEKFNISRRTIYYDMDKINGWLKENQLPVIKHTRSAGFNMDETAKKQIPQKIKNVQTWHYEYSAKERKAWLALYLMGFNTPIYIDDLMERLRVSRNTIIEDLKVLKDDLEKYHLKIEFERKKGYVLLGAEEDKRKAIVFYLSLVLPVLSWQDLMTKIPFFLNGANTNGLDLFEIEKLKAVHSIVSEVEKNLKLQFTDDFLHSLVFRLWFFGKRLEQGKKVWIDPVEKEILRQANEYDAAIKIGKKLAELFNARFPEDEILYITKHLLSSKVQASESFYEDINNDTLILSRVVEHMVVDFQKYACIFLEKRELVVRNLLLHVKPAFYRIKYGLEVENPVAGLIKEKYEDIFLITKKVIHHLEEALGKEVNEDETALIAMHFGGWVKRSGITPAARKKAILVCTNGVGTSRILEHQLEGLFSTIDIIGSVSLREYERNHHEADFVISTTPIQTDKPVFVVSPILTESEKEGLLRKVNAISDTKGKFRNSVDAVMEIIHKYANVTDEDSMLKELRQYLYQPKKAVYEDKKPELKSLLTKEKIQLITEAIDWKHAVKIAADPLVKDETVNEEYVQSMIDTITKMGPYIVIAPKVAVPHARPEDGVRKLGMSLLRLSKSVSFSENHIHDANLIIVLAAIDEQTHLKALSQLTAMLSNPKNIESLIAAQTPEEILRMVDIYSNRKRNKLLI
ncbi:PTS sugar transporter [Bacillus sp. V3-13]|uniref:BglG family transcription antiterminator n=1 Tax=Bacillus sp. V3-13 TaxID=2053728 RepID=UPI000C756DC6|nr:BglG family transcription antiterminator [Bacillus sp. V3-13]PLR75956.1 PTS sugar transporter [Bacillus sp. V3-13]